MKPAFHLLSYGLALVLSPSLQAQWQNDDELFSLSLQQLMNVTIASKKSESLRQAPSAMSIIDQEQIRQFGARNLKDVLDRLVNMQVVGSNLYPHNRLSIRGTTQTHTDNKVLLLMNGRVIRDANQGGINSDIYNFFPVATIKKIEIIRGPGSTLFGTNAFSGVINIITHDELQGSQLSFSAGQFGSLQGTLESAHAFEQGQVHWAIHQSNTDGETFHNLNGEFSTSGDYQTNKKASQFLLNGQYQDFTFNALLSDSQQEHVKSLFQFPSSDLNIERYHVDVGYSHDFSSDYTLESNLTYNFHEVDFAISNTRDTRTDSQDYLLESDLKASLSDSANFILGVRYERLQGTIGNQSTSPTHFDTYQYGWFAQYDNQLNEKNKVVLGVQFNDSELADARLSPRLAFIHHFSTNWTGKLLYGEAFRSPFATDLFLDSPSLQGNPDLEAETIATYDLQLLYLSDARYMSTTLYASQHKDLHQRVDVNGTPSFVNQGQVDYVGLEFELREKLNSHSELTLNASYQENEDQDGVHDTTFNPNTMIKLGWSHRFDNGMQLSVFDGYFSKPSAIADVGSAPENINHPANSYHWVTLNIQLPAQKLFPHKLAEQLKLSVYVDNALDETIYFPSINRQNVSTLPHHNGRSLHLNTVFQF